MTEEAWNPNMDEAPRELRPGDFVHKRDRHLFQGWIISVGRNSSNQTIVTVEHWPEEWIFHFRAEQLKHAEPQTMDERHPAPPQMKE